MMNAIDREKNRIWLTPCVSLIIFIKPEINTGDIGDRRDSGQLKNEKKKTTSAIAIWGYRLILFHS